MPTRAKIAVHGFNPYKAFRFRLRWGDGHYIGGFKKVKGLDVTLRTPDYQAGGAPSASRKLPVSTNPVNVMLEWGVTYDSGFVKWIGMGAQTWRGDQRRDLIVEICNETGTVTLSWLLHHAWVTKFQGIPDLDAQSNAVTIAMMTLGSEGRETYPP